ncbi:MAG: hypothetical protein ABSF69_23915 [Polyangiaceae bacterium]|jgi:hypothetical protein
MADYCGLYGGIAANRGTPRGDVLGDFLPEFERVEPHLMPFLTCKLGICEGHGTGVKVNMDADGKFWFAHVLLDHFKLTKKQLALVPATIEIPAGKLTRRQVEFIEELRAPAKARRPKKKTPKRASRVVRRTTPKARQRSAKGA